MRDGADRLTVEGVSCHRPAAGGGLGQRGPRRFRVGGCVEHVVRGRDVAEEPALGAVSVLPVKRRCQSAARHLFPRCC